MHIGAYGAIVVFRSNEWRPIERPRAAEHITIHNIPITLTLFGTKMEVENYLFVEERALPRGHFPLPCLFGGIVSCNVSFLTWPR